MAITLVQQAVGATGQPWTGAATLAVNPTPGNLLLLWKAQHNDVQPALQSGFTAIAECENAIGHDRHGRLMYRIVQSGDLRDDWSFDPQSANFHVLQEWSGASVGTFATQDSQSTATPFTCGGAVTPTAGLPCVVIGYATIFNGSNEGTVNSIAPGASITEDFDNADGNLGGGHDVTWVGHRAITSPGGSYTISGTVTAGDARPISNAGVTVVLESTAGLAPEADFTADLFSGVVPTTICFTDLSTNSPTSWAWTFGDGGTSTSQNPCHTYSSVGTFSVTLTATNASGSDSETKTAYITVADDVGYEDPGPGAALIEIYAAEAGAARWDVATWDDAVWSTAGWQDVTPESIEAQILWGAADPESGILSKPTAGSWAIDIYDPLRTLDPANEDSPYFGDIIPYLPVRVTHRGIVIRQGLAEAILHNFENDTGVMRVFDNQSVLSNADVPSDTSLSNTLFARAVDAISAAGLGDSIRVLPAPPSGDPAVAAWETGVNEWTAWQWIQDAAEQALHIPYVDRVGRLGFRAWSSPLSRARTLDESRMVGLESVVDYLGMYSQVTALDSITDTVEARALTPPPRFGVRTYSRDDPTLDAGDWAQTVLADRAFGTLRWVPGTLYPLTASDVELFATIEAGELVALTHGTADPDVLANLIIVGGQIRITAKKEGEAKWWFTFNAVGSPLVAGAGLPLTTEDGTGFLTNEDGTDFLYADL